MHYQLVHHGIWDFDIPCAILVDITINGRTVGTVGSRPNGGFFVQSRDRRSHWPIVRRLCHAAAAGNGIHPRSRFRQSRRHGGSQAFRQSMISSISRPTSAEALAWVRNTLGRSLPIVVSKPEGPYGTILTTGVTNLKRLVRPESSFMYMPQRGWFPTGL
jgi:quinoprotein glucose dehydrogenase